MGGFRSHLPLQAQDCFPTLAKASWQFRVGFKNIYYIYLCVRGEQGSLCATALALKSEENVWESGSLLPPCGTQELNAGQDGLLPSTFNGRAISAAPRTAF